jgi:hypothetical protein
MEAAARHFDLAVALWRAGGFDGEGPAILNGLLSWIFLLFAESFF